MKQFTMSVINADRAVFIASRLIAKRIAFHCQPPIPNALTQGVVFCFTVDEDDGGDLQQLVTQAYD